MTCEKLEKGLIGSGTVERLNSRRDGLRVGYNLLFCNLYSRVVPVEGHQRNIPHPEYVTHPQIPQRCGSLHRRCSPRLSFCGNARESCGSDTVMHLDRGGSPG